VAEGFHHLFQSFIHRDALFEVASAAQLEMIFVSLRRKIMGAGVLQANSPKARISKSLDHIHRHYASAITVSALADIEYLSVSRYCALFRQCMGVSPQSYLLELRLKMAIELMLGTDLGVKQISKKVGYDDPLYFSRLFKLRRGMSPRQYIASMGEAR
jgi:YesN/AraC family two-component response regulator